MQMVSKHKYYMKQSWNFQIYIYIYRNCRMLYVHLQPLFLLRSFLNGGFFYSQKFLQQSSRPMLASSGEDLKIRLWGQERNKPAITSDELCEFLKLLPLVFFSRWWFQLNFCCFIFYPDPWGDETIIWLYNMFQLGYNHQPVRNFRYL